ncbi:sodium/glucose cotransporter 1-like [Dermatophagoides pteronyssinus]|uniref:Sodium/glucose cotransporter 1-like n=1 Tax=Dermatophagoides pteronyssinus TaxID=6956 RepID=A0A6P6XYT2_DERPT|nr:sodium/glucose cotransporter 1-like [Dermatophagoides pteronyssinus]
MKFSFKFIFRYSLLFCLILSMTFVICHQSNQNINDDEKDFDLSVSIGWTDYLAIGIYFVLILAVGFWSSRTNNQKTVDGYFLAGRQMHWLLVGASIFSSNIGSEHFIGLAGSGASSGIGIASFEYVGIYTILILGWYFMPVYLASNISTMPEYLQKRFGGQRIRIYLSVLTLILYIFTKISANLYAGAIFIRLLLKIDNILIGCIILIVISALFTIIGGLTAVIWTDAIQTALMLIGAIYLSVTSVQAVGGYEKLMKNFAIDGLPDRLESQSFIGACNASVANNSCLTCSSITPYYRNLFRPATDPEIPWPGIISIFISSLWYFCSDQVIVQRALAARNLTHVKAGCILASLLKITPMFLLVLPGMAARVLWPNQIGCSNPDYCQKICESQSGCTNFAYPYLVIMLLPKGATGLMFSVIVAALMSSLTSIFNSASTIFIIDIYLRFRKKANETEQIIVGRCFVAILVIISVIWVPILEQSHNSQLFPYIQSVTSYLSPPLCAIYVLALFWPRITESGAFWSLIVGLLIGLTRFILEYSYSVPTCGTIDIVDRRPSIITKVHYLHFGIISFTVSMLLAIIISLATEKIDSKRLFRLTYITRHSEEIRQDDNTIVVNDQQQRKTDAELHAAAAKDDNRFVQLTNIVAIIVIIIGAFFWGFYA